MATVNWLKKLILVENVLGIFRNYIVQKNGSYLKRIKKYLILLQIFVHLMLHSIAVLSDIYYLYTVFKSGVFSQLNMIRSCFALSAYINAFSSIVTGICYSNDFMSYYKSISFISEMFNYDKKSNNSLKKLYWFSISFILVFILFGGLRAAETFAKYSPTASKSWQLIILTILLLSQAVLKFTVTYEHYMYFVVIMILFYLFKCLNSMISVANRNSLDGQCDITREQIQGWVEMYRNLLDCSEKLKLCFGHQFSLSLSISMLHYILVIYLFIYNRTSNKDDIYEYQSILIIIFAYLLVMMMPIVAGQMVSNQGVKCRCALARLYNTMSIGSGEVEAKTIKDFIRLIKKNPLEIKLVSKVPAGMYMLPVLFTLAVNYVIVMLQFNHVI